MRRCLAFIALPLVLCLAILIGITTVISPTPAHADVRGIAFGYVITTEANFDGLGSCRLVIFETVYNVIDFSQGELADACAAAPTGGVHYMQVIVDALDPIPCMTTACSKVSAMSHYAAAGVVIPRSKEE